MADGLHISTRRFRNQIHVLTAGIFWSFLVGRVWFILTCWMTNRVVMII